MSKRTTLGKQTIKTTINRRLLNTATANCIEAVAKGTTSRLVVGIESVAVRDEFDNPSMRVDYS